MKKLLTILLSILMVVTIGTVNVFGGEEETPAPAKYKLVVKVDGTETDTEDLDFAKFIYKHNDDEIGSLEDIKEIADKLPGTCAKEEHSHDDSCLELLEEGLELVEDKYYKFDCDIVPHTHSASPSAEEELETKCFTQYTRTYINKSSTWSDWSSTLPTGTGVTYYDINGNSISISDAKPNKGGTSVVYVKTCTLSEHTHGIEHGCYEEVPFDSTTQVIKAGKDSKYDLYNISCGIEPHTHLVDCDNTVTVALTSAERQYTVKFFVDGELYATALTSSFKVTAPKENPEKVGFVFNGWFTEEKVEDQGEEEFDFDTEIKDNLDLYAGWYGSDKKIAMNNKDAKSIEASGTIYQLTTEEEKALKDKKDKKGNMSYIEFIVKGETASEEKLNNAAKGETMFAQEDVTITNHIWRTNKKGKVIGQEYKNDLSVITPGYVELCVDIKDAESVASGYYRVWTVRTLHDGEVEEIDNLKINGTTLTFKADKFSVFSVSYKDVKKQSPSPKPSTTSTPKKVTYVTPKTGIEG